MSRENHLVLTTIRVPHLLKDYYRNFKKYNRLNSVKVWIVGDVKTPKSVGKLARELTSKGLETIFLDIETQKEWGKRYPKFFGRLPFNNETRRNIGYLHALAEGCDRLISIDDDNWPTKDDFIWEHRDTGREWRKGVVVEEDGFYNVCEELKFSPARPIYPRGYPFSLRAKVNKSKKVRLGETVVIGVKMGLWLEDPDVDAITWLNGPVHGVSYKGNRTVVLSGETWIPINTQNTSVTRELIPAFLCIPMGKSLPGGTLERYGDVWAGYFLQALIRGFNYRVAYGRPLVDHKRNPHDYVDDLRKEYWGMVLTDWMVRCLREKFRPSSLGINERIKELSVFIETELISSLPEWAPKDVQDFLKDTAGIMVAWANICKNFVN